MKFRVEGSDQEYFCQEKETLLEVLLREGFFVNNPCNGTGVCGKCKIKVCEGDVSAPNEVEQKFLSTEELRQGIRLSCMVEIEGDVQVALLEQDKEHKVLTEGYLPEFTMDRLEKGLGICMDIGTTTVVTSLIDLQTGKELSSASMINAQKHFGLDVLTRITYEYEHPETGKDKLQKAIVDSINQMIKEACQKAGHTPEEIVRLCIAANCTMMHMLLGVDARSIGRAPYTPVFLEAQEVTASSIGIQVAKEATVYCLPQVSAYIGADIVAGAYVCGLHRTKKNILFIDIGTNGEIVLAKEGRLLCCSCAAGPALEGMNISCGMRAAKGAIEDVEITPEKIQLTTIGDTLPEGLCGSGILAVVKELLRTGIVKKTGAFIRPESLQEGDFRQRYIGLDGKKRYLILQEEPLIKVTQGDVRQVQLAKGAILSGFVALLQKAEMTMEDLDKVMIAGQFGAHLPADSLVGTGILPREVYDKLEYVGNSSKTGAYMCLLSKQVQREMEKVANTMEYIELAETEQYERIFTDSMIFPAMKDFC